MQAVRTWKRDGSRNVMDIEVASINLASNTGIPASECRRLLEEGVVLETRFALFAVDGVSVESRLAGVA